MCDPNVVTLEAAWPADILMLVQAAPAADCLFTDHLAVEGSCLRLHACPADRCHRGHNWRGVRIVGHANHVGHIVRIYHERRFTGHHRGTDAWPRQPRLRHNQR